MKSESGADFYADSMLMIGKSYMTSGEWNHKKGQT